MNNDQTPRRFDFIRDRFGFANELLWEYRLDPATGRMNCHPRKPKPDYTHRCFVLVRSARQFLYHTRFDPAQPIADELFYRKLVRETISRNPRSPCAAANTLVIPGYTSLREFSSAWDTLMKTECGGAWRSYVLRSHWRMVFPITRKHQERTAVALGAALKQNVSPIIHLVRFPSLTMNHGMILFDSTETQSGFEFSAYDPNDPARPARLTFDRARRTFSLPPNLYWVGGQLNIIQIYRSWLI